MKTRFTLLLIVLTLLMASQANAVVRYVKPDGPTTATNAANAQSWTAACSDLQAVINASNSGDEIWVAAGTYKPNRRADATGTITLNDRDNAFVLKEGVKIYGGFKDGDSSIENRNWKTNETILSGDIGTVNNNTDNCYHVVIGARIAKDSGTLLDGFTITGGNANGTSTIEVIHSVSRNYGGGMYNLSSSFPVLTNVTISGNTASHNGGGMYNTGSSPELTNVTISGNTSTYGGGMYNLSSSPELTNVVISENTAGTNGGGIHNNISSPVLTNVTISGNTAGTNGGGMHNTNGSSPIISNSIIWNNRVASLDAESVPVYNSSIVQNVVGQDPLLAADLRPQAGSPAIDAGNDALYTGDIDTDIDLAGNSRKSGVSIDIGAFEFQEPTCRYVKPDGTMPPSKASSAKSWANACSDLQAVINASQPGDQIWVAAGTYKPQYLPGTGTGSATTNNRDKTFLLAKDVKIYGGFAGNETSLNARDWKTNVTTLSGEIGASRSESCYHVVLSVGDVGTACLDGFTITGGNADNIPSGYLTVNSVTAVNRMSGGGIYNLYGSSPTLNNLIITGNRAYSGGGIANLANSSPTISNTVITGNYSTSGASGHGGGGIFNLENSSVQLINVAIYNNTASTARGGAGIYNDYYDIRVQTGNLTLTNVTIAGNSPGGIYFNNSGTLTINNSIIRSNGTTNVNAVNGTTSYNYSLVQGVTTATDGNLDGATNPLFVNTDYSLQAGSPCIDKGSNSLYTSAGGNITDTDLAGISE